MASSVFSNTSRKLKVLCLHGFNNNIDSFGYMTKGIRDKFSEIADFHIINAPFDMDPIEYPPEEGLVSRGFKPPFKQWWQHIDNFASDE